jgi:hypothetical protein
MAEIVTGVVLPSDNIIDLNWAIKQMENVSLFSSQLTAYGRGEVLFLCKTHMSTSEYAKTLDELGYAKETADKYISYLNKREIIEAIKEKYHAALSVGAAMLIPDDMEDALALADICVGKFGKLTEENLNKALKAVGKEVKKTTSNLTTLETAKREAFLAWLYAQYDMTEEEAIEATILKPEGKQEFIYIMEDAVVALVDWKEFYNIIVPAIKKANNPKAVRFVSDLNAAIPSLMESMEAEHAYELFKERKQYFYNEVYPALELEGAI